MNGSKKIKTKLKNIKKNSIPIPKNENNKPGWNDNINNLDKYKLSSADLLKRKINLISKNLIEAKKELHDNYQENQSLAEKKKTKSPIKDIKIKVVSDKIKLNRNRSSNVVRPSTTSNNKSCANKKINYSKKIENKQLNLSANQTEDLDIIEFKPCEKIISTQTKINKLVEINKHDMRNQMNKCKLSKQDELKNASFDSYREKEDNFGDSQQELEENEEEERENYSRTYDEKEVKNEFNDNMIDKFDNLNSIEESMKKLNDILEVSSKNSIKNRYNYGIDKIEKEVSALKDNFGTKEPKKKNDKDFNKSEEKEFVIHQEDNNIENNINLLEKDLKMLQDKFKFRDDDYNYDQSKDNQLFLNDFPKKNIIPKDIYSIEFMEETPMTLPKPFLNSSSIKKYPKRDINKPNLLVFNNDNYNEKSVKNTKNIYNESKIVNVPKPKDFNNKHIESEIQNDENIDYIKNLLLQTENDIKTMNNQLSEYTTKIQMNSKSTTTQQPNNKYK